MKQRPRLLKSVLDNPTLRRELMVLLIQATQARAGIETTKEQAERAYDAIQAEKRLTEHIG